jgi:hypothetical protein
MSEECTVRDLRRWWKPHKERLAASEGEHDTNVRFHRACSWLARTERAPEEDLDFVLLGQWTAFNALYGQWDQGRQEPVADLVCWKIFLERMVELDQAGHVAAALVGRKPLVMSILDDAYLSRFFWQEPSEQRKGPARRAMFKARTWYLDGNWLMILDRLIERIYFLRCQISHGASTFGGKLNRGALRRCTAALDLLLRTFLRVWIEFGADEDWGILCYPPQHARPAAPARR